MTLLDVPLSLATAASPFAIIICIALREHRHPGRHGLAPPLAAGFALSAALGFAWGLRAGHTPARAILDALLGVGLVLIVLLKSNTQAWVWRDRARRALAPQRPPPTDFGG